MNSIIAEIERAVAAAKAALDRAASPADAEAVRIEYLSRNGLFPALSRRMGEVPPEERRATGTAFNSGRCEIETALEAAKSRLATAANPEETLDVTLAGRRGRAPFFLQHLQVKAETRGKFRDVVGGKLRGTPALEHRQRLLMAANLLRNLRLRQPKAASRVTELLANVFRNVLHGFFNGPILSTKPRVIARVIYKQI